MDERTLFVTATDYTQKPIIFTMKDCPHCTTLKSQLGTNCELFEFRDTTDNKDNLDIAIAYGIKLMPSIVYMEQLPGHIAGEPSNSYVKVIENPEITQVFSALSRHNDRV